jgi:hypothetical protein
VVSLYHDALPDLCKRQNVSVTDFCKLIVHYSASRRVVIEIEDKKGRKSTDEYLGSPLTRIKIADSAGRIRPKPTLHT